MINLIIWRYKTLITEDSMEQIQKQLDNLILNETSIQVNPGKELCQANAVYLSLIIQTYRQTDTQPFVYKCLLHDNYEIVLSVLNYLLVLQNEIQIENIFQQHLYDISNKNIQIIRNNEEYKKVVCHVFKSTYLECAQKALKLLVLEENSQKDLVHIKLGISNVTDEQILMTLIDCIEHEHDNVVHIYLKSLCNFVNRKLDENNIKVGEILKFSRIIFECVLPYNSDETRSVVVEFLSNNFYRILKIDLSFLSKEIQFELKATLYATMMMSLEDEQESLRLISAKALTNRCILATAARDYLLAHALFAQNTQFVHNAFDAHSHDGHDTYSLFVHDSQNNQDIYQANDDHIAVLAVLALLDFKAQVCMSDNAGDDTRVFDQNEKYNVYLEEITWTRACVEKIKQILKNENNTCQYIHNIIVKDEYRNTFEKICIDHLNVFKTLISGEKLEGTEINPKIEIFVDILSNK